ncbi:MAG: hypothetical protein DRO13_05890 [Thermoprotei archaeon]|nr:MAG: hypothetical protein DRO13_05890 [Thermoprotei archaeon]
MKHYRLVYYRSYWNDVLIWRVQLGALIVVEENEKKTLKRLLSTLASETDLLIGKTISGIIVLGLSALVAIILWKPLNVAHWLVPPLLIMAALISIGIGIILSMFTKTSHGASSLSVILGLMLAFTTGIWFPIEWLPLWMRFLAKIFPVTWAIDAIRSIIVFNAPLSEVATNIMKIVASVIAVYYISIIVYRRLIRKYIEE